MKPVAVLIALTMAACAAEPEYSETTMSDGSLTYTFRCDNFWDECYRAAAKVCGARGFDEVARSADGTLSSGGRLERMPPINGGMEDQRYSETTRETLANRIITVRCR